MRGLFNLPVKGNYFLGAADFFAFPASAEQQAFSHPGSQAALDSPVHAFPLASALAPALPAQQALPEASALDLLAQHAFLSLASLFLSAETSVFTAASEFAAAFLSCAIDVPTPMNNIINSVNPKFFMLVVF
jgi:hypothetical protein